MGSFHNLLTMYLYFASKISEIKHSDGYITWNEAYNFSRDLELLLESIMLGIENPIEGCKLLAAFFECDEACFENCDDSSGYIGTVFSMDAAESFAHFAKRCPDKEWIQDLILELVQNDNYGVRGHLFKYASVYLPEPAILSLMQRIQNLADTETDARDKKIWLNFKETLSRQLNNPELFIKTKIAVRGSLMANDFLEIAQAYMEAGDAKTALSWLEKITDDEVLRVSERDNMLLQIYGHLGLKEKQTDLTWNIFRSYRTTDSLNKLLSLIGTERREEVLRGELTLISANSTLSLYDAEFLADVGYIKEAAQYVIERMEQVSGILYHSLQDLAQVFEKNGYRFAASVIYRALLDSILTQGKSKIYHYGISYLRKLDQLAPYVEDWKDLPDHQSYVEMLLHFHKRKTSFWGSYFDP
jgi:hypothetical protein